LLNLLTVPLIAVDAGFKVHFANLQGRDMLLRLGVAWSGEDRGQVSSLPAKLKRAVRVCLSRGLTQLVAAVALPGLRRDQYDVVVCPGRLDGADLGFMIMLPTVWQQDLDHESALARVIENFDAIIGLLDCEMRFTAVNSRMLKVFRRSREELIGKPMREVNPTEQGKVLEELGFHIMASGRLESRDTYPVPGYRRGIVHSRLMLWPMGDGEAACGGLAVVMVPKTGPELARAIEEQREHLFGTAAELLGQAMIFAHLDGRVVVMSSAARELMTDRGSDEFNVKTDIPWVYPEVIQNLFEDIARGADFSPVLAEVEGGAGTMIFRVRAHGLREVGRVTHGMLLHIEDVTETENDRRLLSETARDLAFETQVLDRAAADRRSLYAVIDRDLRILKVSSTAPALYGTSIDETVGRPIYEVDPGIRDDGLDDHIIFVIDHRQEYHIDALERSRPDGTKVILDIDFYPVTYMGRDCCLMIGRNATRAALLERRLARVDDLGHKVMGGVSDGVVILDRDGRITDVNSTIAGMLGAPSDQIIGRHYYDILTVNETELLDSFMRKVYLSGKPQSTGPLRLTRKAGGEQVFVDITYLPLRDGGMVTISRFMTELKRLEKQVEDYTRNLERMVEAGIQELRARDDQISRLAARPGGDVVTGGLERILGESPEIEAVREAIGHSADGRDPVLITGECGVGKDLVAEAIHFESRRRDKQFQRVLCSAIPAHLFESEMFGHERGAFTSAHRATRGIIKAADGGTVFLNEIAEMPTEVQAKLLQVIEHHTYGKVGGEGRVYRTSARFLAATNADIRTALRERKIRPDLFHRLNTTWIQVPPLRERGQDIILLAEHFIAVESTNYRRQPVSLSPEARAMLLEYAWPGNVRELRTIMVRVVMRGSDDVIRRDAVLGSGMGEAGGQASDPVSLKDAVKKVVADYESERIRKTLEVFGGNRTKTAEHLGMSYRNLMFKLKRYGLS
jgi:PAS domain S-box-containing protein